MWLGIDFSGDHKRWRPGCTRSNIYIAWVEEHANRLSLRDLKRVQELPGTQHPFNRLTELLATGDYAAAAIDAPFSIPARFVPKKGHEELLCQIGDMPYGRRPFPEAREFVASIVCHSVPMTEPKPLRATELTWPRHMNIRSTMFAKNRGGASFTAACLALLYQAHRPMWPWADPQQPGILVEGYPAAQLYVWGLPYQRYSEPTDEHTLVRRTIVGGLADRITIPSHFKETLVDNADAIDAVVCSFAGIAVTSSHVHTLPGPGADTEGWISVHSI